ncbi:hypothetical protein EZV62_010824 [Acer yangbiense]|uniref:Ferritin n=1 Tax=Acer yangbiense TaxID=1000413 RepID=A0A5C7I3N0_9ROSI|nr:hypothetical protein EZV62_010824 [Acer yangbiense]
MQKNRKTQVLFPLQFLQNCVEYNVSYVYHALFTYFDRDNVALKGLAKFFKESSLEEREHAEKLMEYQNKRGRKVKICGCGLETVDHALFWCDEVLKVSIEVFEVFCGVNWAMWNGILLFILTNLKRP